MLCSAQGMSCIWLQRASQVGLQGAGLCRAVQGLAKDEGIQVGSKHLFSKALDTNGRGALCTDDVAFLDEWAGRRGNEVC